MNIPDVVAYTKRPPLYWSSPFSATCTVCKALSRWKLMHIPWALHRRSTISHASAFVVVGRRLISACTCASPISLASSDWEIGNRISAVAGCVCVCWVAVSSMCVIRAVHALLVISRGDDDSDLYQPMDTCTYHPCGTLADTDRCRNIPSVDLMEGLHHP